MLALLICASWAVRTAGSESILVQQVVPVIAFVGACFAVRTVLMRGVVLERAVWVTLAAWVLVHAADALSRAMLKASLWACVL